MTKNVGQRTKLQIKGHNVIERLANLATLEAQLDAIRPNGSAEVPFRIVGNWLVRNNILWDFLRSSFSRKPLGSMSVVHNFLAHKSFLTFRHLLFASRIRARTSADAVCFKSNLRAFYLNQQPLTLWICTKREMLGKLRRAMDFRGRLPPSPVLRAPRVIAQDTTAELPYVLEELVTGRPFGRTEDWALLVDKVLPSLFGLYDQEYIRHHPAAEIYDAEWIYQGVVKSISNFRNDKKWMPRPEQLLEAVEQCLRLRDETIPLCTGHGDLNRTNLVVAADGSIVILDWEWSRELPIAEEVIKLVPVLADQHPQLLHRLATELWQRTEDPITMPPKRQVLLATLKKVATNSDRAWKVNRWLKLTSNLITGPDW